MAWRSTSTAIAGTQPNLRDSGHSAPSPSVSTRQNTRAPGAARAIFSTSSTQSTANRRMPSAIGARDVALLLDGVAEGDAVSRRAGVHRHLDFGNRRGVEGRAHRGEQAQDLRRRVGLHRIVDLRIAAAPSRRRGNCRARRRGRRPGRGRSDVGWRGNRGCAGWPSGLSIARHCARAVKAARRGLAASRDTRWTKAGRQSMEPAGGDPGTMKRRRAAVNLGLARLRFALSALAWMGDPSALPAMKVCLFSNPGLWTTGRTPERPAPSLLQGVLGSGGWPLNRLEGLAPGYLTDFLAIRGSADTHRHVRLWASAI